MILFVIVESEFEAKIAQFTLNFTEHSSLDMINSFVKFDEFDDALT